MTTFADRVVLLGVKHSVLAFDKQTGARLWSRDFGGGLSGDFVSLLVDAQRVYVHCRGQFHCLDLATGGELWRDELSGFGYGIASIAVPGNATNPALAQHVKAQEAAQAAGGATAAS